MTVCTVTTGFFVLRRCGRPPVAGCPACGRPLCAIHIADAGLCPECAAQRGYLGNPHASSAHHRRGFFSSSGHDFGDVALFQRLDDFDRAPFDPGAGGETEYDADGGDGDDRLVDS
jgi:hypothetical protein